MFHQGRLTHDKVENVIKVDQLCLLDQGVSCY